MSPRNFAKQQISPYFLSDHNKDSKSYKTEQKIESFFHRFFTIPRKFVQSITKRGKKSQGIPEEFFKDQQFFEE